MKHLFQSYPKIPESFDAFQLSEADYRLFKKTDWVVTEKIHGANFCVLSNGEETQFAKRKAVLDEEENFFGYHSLRNHLTAQVAQVFAELKRQHADTVAVAVYGELFGGAYPHPDVTAVTGVQAIQTGIYYCPEVRFWVFDLVRITDTSSYFVDFDNMRETCDTVGLPYVPALLVGTFSEVQNYAIEFESTIAGLLGLPALPTPNLAEGVVIKPATSLLMDTAKGWVRPVIKKKIEKFGEDIRYQQAKKWAGKAGESTVLGELMQAVHQLVNKNRLQNVCSKIGIVNLADAAQKEQVRADMEADVWEAFWEQYSDRYFQITSEEQAQVNAEVTQAIEQLL
ncbi:RNA ligase family protein [Microscilla marina]|uniref:RNA ligase 2 n=1 Tax=Microscilla marina ATCC 23134 TaxID=313606 RepID=A1ZC58_MICM2|nr:RNA ligase family protein [Microscilla marina]EAY31860.1 RNA ligase 2 [Microscilla marina ATCC 23134]